MELKLTSHLCPLFVISFILLLSTVCTALSSSQTTVVKHTASADPSADGFWKRNVKWKSRWVKYWRSKAIYVPVWKKVWSPLVQNEWVPLPKVPPGWEARKDGVIDSSSSSDWSSSSGSSPGSSSSSGLRSAKSYSEWGGANSGSSHGSIYSGSSSGSSGWKKGIKRTH
ncbi:PREDICTED: uncharacterized protein LOC108381670, partial [Rhagoletis zephyria]